MRKFLALAACCAAVTVPVALASEGNDTQQPEPVTNPCPSHPLAKARAVVKEAWDREGWRQKNPVKPEQSERLRRLRPCLSDKGEYPNPSAREKLMIFSVKRKTAFWSYREYRQITPYRCQRGWYGTWAIPCYVIACESGFSWSAYNPSGASGPYQLLGWGAPMPANTWARKLEHHRIASSLALSNWVCA